ncbi:MULTISPECIES: thymidine kinase [Caproicibacterium]|uniref:Thymidine kinase n=1 Tax=Caproicibacterium argilliputei TaxID=3030016 RepID=A0AA97DCP5_9FIRM|nr:thymidine kinase [Caproicibacterium argilliputei]WOC33187.1 thymidine kinase [Caproicibacterium argilliputei]
MSNLPSELRFYYGVVGSSKTANALMTQYNFQERGYTVLLMKPSVDTRDGLHVVKSRIGLQAEAVIVRPEDSLLAYFQSHQLPDMIIADEAQFFSNRQTEEFKELSVSIPVYCYGLKVDFQSHLFEGSKRLLELADTIIEIEALCRCGRKATVNARLDSSGNIIREGSQIFLGGNDAYLPMCYHCWKHTNNIYENP